MKQLFSRYLKHTITVTISFFMLLFAATKTNAQWIEVGGINISFYNQNVAGFIKTITTDAGGNVYAGGDFTDANGYRYVAKWNGTTWSELGGANSFLDGTTINSITTDASANVYAAGSLFDVNGNYYVAKWNGTTWSELGGPNSFINNGNINSIITDANGNIYAGGSFLDAYDSIYIAKWNGTSWSELGGAPFNVTVNSIATDASGNVYAGGDFTDVNGNYYVAKWNGTAWIELGGTNGSFNGDIESIATDAAGNVYAGGSFYDTNGNYYVAKWNGTAWSELGGSNNSFNYVINSIAIDARGNVYAGGGFTDANNKSYVNKWNGTAWSELGGSSHGSFDGTIYSIAINSSGNVYIGGDFRDGKANYYVAEYAQNILPVTFVNFTATKQNKSVAINWQTANEINTSYFNIQRSTDGKSFANIGKVAAKGSNKVENNYAYTDNVSELHADRLYYRLQEADNDGKLNYSGVKIIGLNANSVLFTISPNPAMDFINISSSDNVANAEVSVTDMNGRKLYVSKQNFTANQQIKIPASQFAKQVLIVTISTATGKQEFKVVKE